MNLEGRSNQGIRIWAASFVITLLMIACGGGGISQPVQPSQDQPPQINQIPGVNLPVENGIILFQDDFQDGDAQEWQTNGGWFVE